MPVVALFARLALLAALLPHQCAVLADHKAYQKGELVEVYGNKVGPFANPSETYDWSVLPYCHLETHRVESRGLGDVLRGDKRMHTLFDMPFLEDIPVSELCTLELTKEAVEQFRRAVAHDYAFELSVDGIPVHGAVGRKIINSQGDVDVHLYNHFDFEIAYNNDQIIDVVLVQDESSTVALPSSADASASRLSIFTSVTWAPTDTAYHDRLSRYVRDRRASNFVEVHWLSIANSFVLVLLLTGFLSLILMRSVKHDVSSSRKLDAESGTKGGMDDEEAGWKKLSNEVFRPPAHLNLLCACLGTGAQLLLMAFCVLALSLLGTFQPTHRGALYVAYVVLYALTSGVAGFVSCLLYVRLGGKAWTRNVMLVAVVFAGPFTVVAGLLNWVALAYGSNSAVPFTTVILLTLIWILVTFPLTVVGGVAGKFRAEKHPAAYPMHANVRPRQLPPSVPWFASAWFQVLFAGFLPFSAIYIELFYIFTSVWSHKLYTLFGVLGIALVLLVAVTAMITIALVYFQLTAEDYRWWWRSFLCGSSMGMLIYAYGFYYFAFRSDMFGVVQTSFFFGYSLLLSYAVALGLGTVGFAASHSFVQYIYEQAKLE